MKLIFIEILVDVWSPGEGGCCIWLPKCLNLLTAMVSSFRCVVLGMYPLTMTYLQ